MGCLFLFLGLISAAPAVALDFFTLWRQPMIPMQMHEGAWADYRTQVMAGGKREHGITRLVCLDQESGTNADSWLLELLPLEEKEDGQLVPIAGEGLRLRVSRALLKREGRLLDSVMEIIRWQDGVAAETTVEELKADPLISASLQSDFEGDVELGQQTTRVIQQRQYLCDQFVFSAADSQVAELPAGRMVQLTSHEISAAVNSEIPFLGLAYVSERIKSESTLDPPSRKFSPPPARVRVEIMELVAFGGGAKPFLVGRD